MDGEKEIGSVKVPYADVLNAKDMTLQNNFDVGSGAKVRASLSLRGLSAAGAQELELPDRSK